MLNPFFKSLYVTKIAELKMRLGALQFAIERNRMITIDEPTLDVYGVDLTMRCDSGSLTDIAVTSKVAILSKKRENDIKKIASNHLKSNTRFFLVISDGRDRFAVYNRSDVLNTKKNIIRPEKDRFISAVDVVDTILRHDS